MSVRTRVVLMLLALFGLTPVTCPAQALPAPAPLPAQKHAPQAQAHRNKGDKLAAGKDYPGTLREYHAAYLLDQNKAAYRRDTGTDLRKIGTANFYLGRNAQAIYFFQRAVTIAGQTNDRDGEATALSDLGYLYQRLGQSQNAITRDQQALSLYETIKNSHANSQTQARTLNNLGDTYTALSQPDKAIPIYEKSLQLSRSLRDISGQIYALVGIGFADTNLSQYEQALSYFQQALPLCRQIKDTHSQANADNCLGFAYSSLKQDDKALPYFQEALQLGRQVKDANIQAFALTNIGADDVRRTRYDDALSCFQQAVTLYQGTNNPGGQADATNNIGTIFNNRSQFDKAIPWFLQARTLYQRIKNITGQAKTESNLGFSYSHLNQHDKAIDAYQQALALSQGSSIAGQATTLECIGSEYEDLAQYDRANDFYQQALPLFQQIKDISGQEYVLNRLGTDNDYLSRYEQSLQYFQQALPLAQQAHDPKIQAAVLSNLGAVDNDLSRYEQALQCFQQALPLMAQVGDLDSAANMLMNVGDTYTYLGQYNQALQSFQGALTLSRETNDTGVQPAILTNIGSTDISLGQYEKAIPYFQQTLPIFQQTNNILGQANTLNNLGNAYLWLTQYDKASGYYQQALPLFQQIKDTRGEGLSYANLGTVCDDLKQYEKAGSYFQQALPLFQRIQAREEESSTLVHIMALWQQQGQTTLAIFYGKQAINVYQSIRQDNHGLDKGTQTIYLQAKEPAYRQLAELLIQQGRLPEAEQVLGLLKNQEFFDFIQRDAAHAPAGGEASLTPIEASWQTRFAVISDKITTIGQTKQDLLTKKQQADKGEITLSDPEKAVIKHDLSQADADLSVANQAFQDFLAQLNTEFQKAPKLAQDKVQTVSDAIAFEDTLRRLGPGTVALYTIVEPDKVRILVVTGQTQVAREYPIKSADLRAKVLAFRQVLQDPTRDPRPLAHELYTILVGPIENDLTGAKASTLMWSLDDVLRYLPVAALYDGKHYLVERYRTAVFTPASNSRLTETPQAKWNGLGLGVSKEHPGFQALSGVPQELDDVIHDPTIMASTQGTLPGTILLDSAFTQQAMTDALEGHDYPLVHIASHFDFEPGDETASFLLLGDGSHLSLAEIKNLPQVFQGVDLLTLSACDTADGSTGADGHEVEGFAVLAQNQGARAVIASLWPVADASTPLLMETFYRQHASVPGQPKAEALRQAQLSLLHGTATAPASSTQRAEIMPGKSDKSVVTAPTFTPDPKAPFAHPYYWAPFILIGNWK